jgi:glycosyltransferase involved in cell wall biosynthesis
MPTVLNPSGISRASREIYKLIRYLGLQVSTLLTLDEEVELLEKEVTRQMISGSAPFYDDVIQLHVGPPNNMSFVRNAKGIIGMFVCEGQRLSSMQVEPCRRVSACAMPSTFCMRAALASGLPREMVHLVPYPMDSTRWHPDVIPSPRDKGRFMFLFMNSLYERKGLDILLKAFWEEFGRYEPVSLVIKSYRENDRPDPATRRVAGIALEAGINPDERAPVHIIDDPMRDEDIPAFVKSFDAVVSTHRSEGFGMTPWYAMALGVPVICTDYGGVTDFANEETAWMIEVDKMTVPSRTETNIFPHLDGVTWAEPSVESTREQLRACMSNIQENKRRAEEGAQLVAEQYSYERIGENFMIMLNGILPGAAEKLARKEEVSIPPRYDGISPARMIEI